MTVRVMVGPWAGSSPTASRKGHWAARVAVNRPCWSSQATRRAAGWLLPGVCSRALAKLLGAVAAPHMALVRKPPPRMLFGMVQVERAAP